MIFQISWSDGTQHKARLARIEVAISSTDSGNSVVAVMQPAQTSPRDHRTSTDGMGPTPRCLFVQTEMGAVVMVIRDELQEESLDL